MTHASRERFAATISEPEPDLGLACLLVGAEVQPDLDPDAGLDRLDALAATAAAEVDRTAAPYDVATGLRRALGDQAGFRGYGGDYDDLRSSLLHEVLERRRGLPILLSVVYVEVARRLGVPLHGIGLPGHFVVGVPGPEAPVLLDPFYGGRLVTPAELPDGDLVPWDARATVLRVLANVRTLAGRSNTNRTRLWATELSLLVPGAEPGLRRERGALLARLGDFAGAAHELENYAGLIAPFDPETADLVLREARMARSRLS